MNEGEIRDLLPDWVRGDLDPEVRAEVGVAVARSADLAAEVALLRSLLAARPEPPKELLGQVMEAVASPGSGRGTALPPRRGSPRRRGGIPRWWLSAAATVVIGLGGTVVLARTGGTGSGGSTDEPVEVGFAREALVWPTDDGMVAGQASLGDLSEEQLERLLQEMGG